MKNNVIYVKEFDDYIKTFLVKNKFHLIRTLTPYVSLCKDHKGEEWKVIEMALFPTKAVRTYKALIDQRIEQQIIK